MKRKNPWFILLITKKKTTITIKEATEECNNNKKDSQAEGLQDLQEASPLQMFAEEL